MRPWFALVLVPLLTGPSVAQGQPRQPNKPGQPTAQQDAGVEEMLRAAYALRRAGEMKHAVAAFERALELLPRGERKRAVAQETVELCRLIPDLAKAMWIYRRNHDALGEIEVLLEMGKVDEALTVGRLLQCPKGEALALVKRERIDDALRLYEKHSLHRERAELLRAQRRHDEAAAAFALARDPYERALALEAAGKTAQARDALEEARLLLIDQIKTVTNPDLKKAREYFQQGASSGVERERARMELARRAAKAAEDYERLARVYVKLKRPQGDKLAENAVVYVTLQIDTLLDKVTAPGGKVVEDAYGKRLVEQQRLIQRREELRRLVAEGAAIKPPPPQDPKAPPPRRGG